jgi:hypothetical protein
MNRAPTGEEAEEGKQKRDFSLPKPTRCGSKRERKRRRLASFEMTVWRRVRGAELKRALGALGDECLTI